MDTATKFTMPLDFKPPILNIKHYTESNWTKIHFVEVRHYLEVADIHYVPTETLDYPHSGLMLIEVNGRSRDNFANKLRQFGQDWLEFELPNENLLYRQYRRLKYLGLSKDNTFIIEMAKW